jgi:uncharacterized protein (DUF58 family)
VAGASVGRREERDSTAVGAGTKTRARTAATATDDGTREGVTKADANAGAGTTSNETVRRTRRWRGVVAVALVAGAAALLFKRPSLLLLSVVGIAYAAYPRVSSAPTVSLALERRVGEAVDSEDVDVEVTVRNTGGALADLRLVDGVPPMLSVSGGTPRHAAVLRAGEETTFTYEVTARRGTHRFEPMTAIARDVSGAHEVETTVAESTTIECVTDVPEVPLRERTGRRVGELVTDDGGSGIEFHGTREYRRGDDTSRIDWQRFARTGELTTTEFREERATSVVCCLDVREAAYRAADDGSPHAVSYALAAAGQLLAGLEASRDAVGLATIGGKEPCWLAPGAGREHALRARELLATHPALSPYPPDEPEPEPGDADDGSAVADLRGRLGDATQVVLLSPLLDDGAVSAALELEAGGGAVSVVSPRVTVDVDAPDSTPGDRLATVERENRMSTLREAGVRVVDWDPDEPLGTALVHARERWSR